MGPKTFMIRFLASPYLQKTPINAQEQTHKAEFELNAQKLIIMKLPTHL